MTRDVPRVLVADAQRLFAEALGLALRPVFSVIDAYPHDGTRAIEAALRHRPDVAVIDHFLNGVRGPLVALALRHHLPDCKVVMLSSFTGSGEEQLARAVGASVFLDKGASFGQIVAALDAAGRDHAPEAHATKEDPDAVAPPAARDALRLANELLPRLGVRDLTILDLVNRGLEIPQIARELAIQETTMRNYVSQITRKSRARSLTEAVAIARSAGLVRTYKAKSDVFPGLFDPSLGAQPSHPSSPQRSLETVPGSASISLVVADGQRAMAESLQRALASYPELVVEERTPTTAADTIATAVAVEPDIALVDFWMDRGGCEVAREILDRVPGCRVLMTSWLFKPEHVQMALLAGVAAFLPKSAPVDHVVATIRRAKEGPDLVSGERLAAIFDDFADGAKVTREARRRIGSLTPRELEVLVLLSRGKERAEIAREMAIERSTIKFHIRNILRKTETRSQREAIAVARFGGFLSD